MVIGFFMPLPLAMMIPFMGIQSMVMAKQFGENFQYGKRRISAMSNEEFNKLTPQKLLSNANKELSDMIPNMKESMTDMREFQTFIVKEFLLTIRAVIDAGLGKLVGLNPSETNQIVQDIEHFLHGHFEGHGVVETPPGTPPPTPPPTETNLVSLTFQQVNQLSDNQLDHWSNNLHLLTSSTKTLIINEKQRRNRNEPTPEPPKEFPTESEYRVPQQVYINKLQVQAWNNMLKNKTLKKLSLSLAKYWAESVRQLKVENISLKSKAHFEGRKAEVLIIITNFNRSIGA